jgi:hypothetical protein
MVVTVRLMGAAVGVLVALGGLVAIAAGAAGPGLWAVATGAVVLIAVVLERTRYRSGAAEQASDAPGPGGGEPRAPGPPFRRTEERFIDPSSGRRMRVYADPASGERRYHAED